MLETFRLPWQITESKNLSQYGFSIGDKFFVIQFKERAFRQNGSPVIHEPEILPVVEGNVLFLIGEMRATAEVRGVNRKTSIDWISAYVENLGLRERRVNMANVLIVQWHFVCNSGKVTRLRLKKVKIRLGKIN